MGSVPQPSHSSFDVVIIGAGLSGICSLYHLRQRFPSWKIKILEAGTDVGGTWYWNRYPGCRFDSESLSYGFSFDKEMLQEWHWKEAFSPQPETHKYIRRVAEKNDLYKDIILNTRIKSAVWNDQQHFWTFVDELGNGYSARFFISCLGFLSSPTLPAIPGVETFKGESFHTSRWPDHIDINRDFANKRIGIIGTGATGIQTITAISKVPNVKSLSVFQRTANWSAPLRNSEISVQQMDEHKRNYDAIFKICAETPSCFMHEADPRKSTDVTEEEKIALWEKKYNEPGFGKWLGVFSDTYIDRQANEEYSRFMADKIRARVHDKETAESLIPKNHGFGTRRVPLESGYFEAYNKPHINLVDLKKTPITSINEGGINTTDGKFHELDVLIYATGFDAITGAFNAIDWHAKDDRPLIASSDDKTKKNPIWPDHRPRTFLGLTAPAMPNTFMVLGPHQPFGNATRSIEHATQVITDLLAFCKDNGYTYVEPTEQAVQEWTDHVVDCSRSNTLVNEVDSWMTGINTNVKGKTERSVARYAGSAIEYRRRCEDCKASGYKGLKFYRDNSTADVQARL
ncbi:cyclohexanone monooxygenase [Aaosphaeria arxii CBS 175.79]|uniref:Cyclohexanone monooxygenase n=1 Tax=Aaosphaeria arxii CBS 175.79 TaxID=1450172 RepID=A0A6A5Y2S8_9PLEO|nr:cyclohexanone monooxygenase [Aaosphaeria arxii CBS 175.79]KAF2019201.1 cyclohexanone monooxygenase [Aaosphaeria arxii CBS 175.79]